MLAAASWYTSATLWTDAGTIFGVLSVIIAYILWQLGAPRRLLIYSMPVVTALLTIARSDGLAREDLKVMYGTHALSDPYTVRIHVESRSRRDIRSADFDQNRPLGFDLGAHIESRLAASIELPLASNGITIDDTSVEIHPTLIRRGDAADIELLLDGPPALACHSPLVDVKVREQATIVPEKWRLYQIFAIIAGAICCSLFSASLLKLSSSSISGLSHRETLTVRIGLQHVFWAGSLAGISATFVIEFIFLAMKYSRRLHRDTHQ